MKQVKSPTPHVGHQLRQARSARNLTQAQFAAASGVPLRTLIRVEAGDENVKLGTYQRAADALGFTLTCTSKRRPTLDELDALYGDDADLADRKKAKK